MEAAKNKTFRLRDIKPGDVVCSTILDKFVCGHQTHFFVQTDMTGAPYVECRSGRHYLLEDIRGVVHDFVLP